MSTTLEQSRDSLRRNGRTFWLASHFLPSERRDDAAVTYAFCRLVDDISDEAEEGTPPQEIERRLDALRRELRGDAPPRPLVAAFRDVIDRRSIPMSAAMELIAGCRQDAGVVRLETQADVLRYSYRVAGTVGLMMCGVLGVRDPERAMRHAIDLGIAMQLTNISRDVHADAQMDRIYLPGLDGAGDVSRRASAILDAQPEAVAARTSALLALAESYYASGIAGLRYIPRRSRVAIAVAALTYRAIGHRVRARRFAHDAPRAVVGRAAKVVWTVAGVARALFPPLRTHDSGLHAALRGLPGTNPEAHRPALEAQVPQAHSSATTAHPVSAR